MWKREKGIEIERERNREREYGGSKREGEGVERGMETLREREE